MDKLALIIIGLIFISLGTYTILMYAKKQKRLSDEGHQVTARISKFTGRRKNRRAFITYTVNGKEFTAELDHFSNDMKIGDEISLYVDKTNPQDFVTSGKTPIAMGVLFMLIGIGVIVVWLCEILSKI